MKIKDLLKDPRCWTQQSNAKRSDGNPTYSTAPTAVCWCLLGAAGRCYDGTEKFHEVYQKITDEIGQDMVAWNDSKERQHAEVLELVTRLDV